MLNSLREAVGAGLDPLVAILVYAGIPVAVLLIGACFIDDASNHR